MNDMIIRFKWNSNDVSPRRDVAWQRRYVAQHIKYALGYYGSKVEVDEAFIEDAVVFSYGDLEAQEIPEEFHDATLTMIEDLRGSIVRDAYQYVPKDFCGRCTDSVPAGELIDGLCRQCDEERPLTKEEIEDLKGDMEYDRRRDEGLL